ncbi:MAG: hypothetical protein LBB57_03725, partial [Clostridiales Family XIII bacterium]|nr:hypothetical protein [Clostridiales Family XIII bacterium]
TDGARIEELTAAVIAAQTVYNNASAASDDIKNARDALAAAIGTSSGPGQTEPEPEDKDDFILEPGDYKADIKLWHYSANQASMGNGALAHDQSFVRVGEDGTAEAHIFFGPLTFIGLSGHLEQIKLVTNIQKDANGIVTGYDKTPATVISDYGTLKDNYGPINIASYPHEVSIPVEIGKTYTTVEVFVPVMEKAVGGAGTQLARLQIDWSAFGVEEKPETDKAALNAAAASAEAVLNAGRGNKTESSWNAFVNALNAAKTVAADASATQSAVDAALAALTAAQSGLADEPPAAKTPEASATVTVTTTPEVRESNSANGGTVKIVENTVSAEAVAEIAQQAAAVAAQAKSNAAAKIAAGETVVAEIKIVTALPQNVNPAEVKETVTNVSASAIRSIIAESAKEAHMEIVLTVENGLASVTLDSAEMASLVAGADNATVESISITVISDARNAQTPLPAPQNAAVPAGKLPFAVVLSADGTPVTGTLTSEIAITIPHAAPAAGKKLVVYYVGADGSKTKHDASYDAAKGTLTFTTKQI